MILTTWLSVQFPKLAMHTQNLKSLPFVRRSQIISITGIIKIAILGQSSGLMHTVVHRRRHCLRSPHQWRLRTIPYLHWFRANSELHSLEKHLACIFVWLRAFNVVLFHWYCCWWRLMLMTIWHFATWELECLQIANTIVARCAKLTKESYKGRNSKCQNESRMRIIYILVHYTYEWSIPFAACSLRAAEHPEIGSCRIVISISIIFLFAFFFFYQKWNKGSESNASETNRFDENDTFFYY